MKLLCVLFALSFPPQSLSQGPAAQPPKAAGWKAKYDIGNGQHCGPYLTVTYDTLPLIVGSILRVNGWIEAEKSPALSVTETNPSVTLFLVRHTYTNGAGATERFEMKKSGVLTAQLRILPGSLPPATVVWAPAQFVGTALSGANWRAEGVDYSSPKGVISEKTFVGEFTKSIVAQKFWTLDTENTTWKLRVAPGQDSPDALLADAIPAQTGAPAGERRFWLGFVGIRTAPGEDLVRTIRLDLTHKDPAK